MINGKEETAELAFRRLADALRASSEASRTAAERMNKALEASRQRRAGKALERTR